MGKIDQYPRLAEAYRRLVVWSSRTIKGIDVNKVVFSCFQGRSYGDSPRVISERLHERCPQAKLVWLLNKEGMKQAAPGMPDYVKLVPYKSRASFVELATARVWVDNFTKHNCLRWPKGRQFYIQTWHGDRAIKKICYDLELPGDRRVEEKCARVTTASRFGEEMFRTAFRYRGEYIRAGMPRNDILVRDDPAEAARIREKLGVAPGTRLLLYAPTYRENASVVPKRAQMDLDRTLRKLEQKTGERWLCLYRAHYLSEGIDLEAVRDRIVDVTRYEDMSQLLLAADMVLTDYSSCGMDFIIRNRPALFFIADWDEYISTRGVYIDMRHSPFLTAENQDALETLIDSLTPERVLENCAAIREWFGYYETGRATDAVCDYIIQRLGNDKKWPD
ncbi:MAG: CDP-glycerol glycerophosphotransferase family protein [Clostridia bacterium]|nr:CDP-glycerol glycerophosphotransferase family protein [Clostridia bacterium]